MGGNIFLSNSGNLKILQTYLRFDNSIIIIQLLSHHIIVWLSKIQYIVVGWEFGVYQCDKKMRAQFTRKSEIEGKLGQEKNCVTNRAIVIEFRVTFENDEKQVELK